MPAALAAPAGGEVNAGLSDDAAAMAAACAASLAEHQNAWSELKAQNANLATQLPPGFTRLETAADGNCFFHALAQVGFQKQDPETGNYSPQELRALACSTVRELSGNMEFFEGDDAAAKTANMNAYIANMQEDGVYVDGRAIAALQVKLNFNVHLHEYRKKADEDGYELVQHAPQAVGGREVHLLLINKPGFQHYETLVSAPEAVAVAAGSIASGLGDAAGTALELGADAASAVTGLGASPKLRTPDVATPFANAAGVRPKANPNPPSIHIVAGGNFGRDDVGLVPRWSPQ